jgi:hypothetical protein
MVQVHYILGEYLKATLHLPVRYAFSLELGQFFY